MANRELHCGHCHATAKFIVTRDVPGSAEIPACKSHVVTAMEKIASRAQAGSVTVYLLEAAAGSVTPSTLLEAAEVLEQVRRIGAHSAEPGGRTSHLLEDQLYLRVLFAIAQGAQQPAGLAGAALMSRRYEFERTIS